LGRFCPVRVDANVMVGEYRLRYVLDYDLERFTGMY